jgi:hypothetical protein
MREESAFLWFIIWIVGGLVGLFVTRRLALALMAR